MIKRLDIVEMGLIGSMIVIFVGAVIMIGWIISAGIAPNENADVSVKTTMIMPSGMSSVLFENIKSYKQTKLGLEIMYEVSWETFRYVTLTDSEDQKLFIESYLKWRGE